MAENVKTTKTSEEKTNNSIKKKVFTIIALLLSFLIIVWLIISVVSANSIINPQRQSLKSSPDELGFFHENVSFKSYKGETLNAWYIPAQLNSNNINESSKTVITSHNYQANREMLTISGLYYVRYLVEEGYNVLMFDYSGSGESSGRSYTFGIDEKDELLAAIDYIKERLPSSQIALHGWAFGAAAAIMAGAESDDVTTIIADSSYDNLNTYLNKHISMWSGLPSFLFKTPVKSIVSFLLGGNLDEISPLKSVRGMNGKNIYLIHSSIDYVIPETASENLYYEAIKNNNAELWIAENSLHLYGFMDYEENYVNGIIDFLNKTMQ